MAEQILDPAAPPGLHFISAFLSMEPTDTLISLARACGGCFITERVQRFVWDHYISTSMGKGNTRYLKIVIKKLIVEVESSKGTVLDELYEQYGYVGNKTKQQDDVSGKANVRACKYISFIFPDGCSEHPSCPKSRKLVIPLHCSLNMLEGDTGCSIWSSSLYLSEFILSFPEKLSNKSCFEVGSGVDLGGICLSHVKASEVILSDGDLSTLANMKTNLELQYLRADCMPEESIKGLDTVQCIILPWESATKNELQEFTPEIILGADIIYDPSCLPYLVQVLDVLLNKSKTFPTSNDTSQGLPLDTNLVNAEVCSANEGEVSHAAVCGCGIDRRQVEELHNGSSNAGQKKGPVAYIASVIRNIDTFSCFLQLAEQANRTIRDITETQRPFDLLPYMESYNRSSIHLFCGMAK